jgi:subtilisin family serine protease
MLDTQAGHGTFISGIIRRLCPDARVHIDGVLSSFGDGDDISVADGVERAQKRIKASTLDGRPGRLDLIVMSLGCYTESDAPPPLAQMLQRIVPDVPIVASAGNCNSCRPSYPAFMNDVIAVGALDVTGRAWFSNFGGWVDACAPGVDVVSTFFLDEADSTFDFERSFTGWATWSGTSFAAPKVAAVLLQEFYLANTPDAKGGDTTSVLATWRRLSHWQTYRYADLGIVFNVR